jgi:predicted RNA-binding protein YlxR (DUF448 family)
VQVDPTGKLPGRGAYLHDVKSCWEKGLKGPLANALRTLISEQDLAVLTAYMAGLQEEAAQTEVSSQAEMKNKEE